MGVGAAHAQRLAARVRPEAEAAAIAEAAHNIPDAAAHCSPPLLR
jgi:hypothetical protein